MCMKSKFSSFFSDFLKRFEGQSLQERLPVFVATLISVQALMFFSLIVFPEISIELDISSLRVFGFVMFLLAVFWSLLGVILLKPEPIHGIAIAIESILLTMGSYAYIVRLQGVGFTGSGLLSQLAFDTSWVFIPLTFLIFFVNYNLYGSQKRRLALVIGQVMMFLLLTLGFLSYISEDRSSLRIIDEGWLRLIFSQSEYVWLTVCSLAISTVTALNYQLKEGNKLLLFWMVQFIVTFFTLLVVYGLGRFSYWYQTLLFLILWDFASEAIYTVARDVKDDSFKPRLWISFGYHLALAVLVMGLGIAIQ